MSNYVEQWNEHVIKGNKISRELESFDTILQVINRPDSKVALYYNGEMSFIDLVLPEDVMDNIKQGVLLFLNKHKASKETEIKNLMGIQKSEPDTVEEKLTYLLKQEADRIAGSDKSLDKQAQEISKPEMTIDAVKNLYIEEGRSYQYMAEYFGVKKTDINNFITRNHLRELKQKHDCGYKEKKPDEKERP